MIDVLLATYKPNAKWLKAQVDSIQAQAGVDVNVICREDNQGLGACRMFDRMLRLSTADYVAFSDQDDVWRPEKLSKCLARLKLLEQRHGRETPLLVFCDGRVTDRHLHPYPGTVISWQGISVGKGLRFGRLLMQNFISGNAMVFNAALREKAGEIPAEALMHDAWIGLVAAAFGQIGFVDEPLYDYRQHDGNSLGATAAGVPHSYARAKEGVPAFRERLTANILQAQAFVARFGKASPAAAEALANFNSQGFWAKRYSVLRHRLYKQGFSRNLSLFLFA